jgi:hypothetical protein
MESQAPQAASKTPTEQAALDASRFVGFRDGVSASTEVIVATISGAERNRELSSSAYGINLINRDRSQAAD